jgi:hypothetical protein
MNFMSGGSQFRSLFCAALVLSTSIAVHAQNSAATSPVASPQLSSGSPKVSYINGQLTILAQDASLGEVLRAVSVKTGAVIEFPSDRAQEHLFANAGPGPVREVLSAVLNGSHFNYVMLASPTNPNVLQRMILTTDIEPTSQPIEQPVQAAAVQPQAPAASQAQPQPELAPPSVAMAQAEIDQLAASKDPLTPEALAALMKARREARKLERDQEAPSSSQ